MKKILLLLTTLLFALNGWAFDYGNLKYTIEKHDGSYYAMVVGFADGKNPTSITIPSIVDSDVYPYKHYVYGVNSSSFKSKTAITSVIFPESSYFKCINASAFEGCTGLTSITIPSGIGEITDDNDKGLCRTAFKGCTNLKTVTINSETLMTSTSSSKGVGDAFLNATTINMGDKVTTIGNYAFKRGDKDLALTTFNCNKATSIGDYAFENALNLTSIDFGNVTTIGKSAFLNCPKLTSVHIGKLASDANLPSTVTTYVFDELATKTSGSYSLMHDILDKCESEFTVTNTSVTKLVFGANVKYIYQGILGSSDADRAKLGITVIECKYDGVGLGRFAFSGLTKLTTFTGKPGYIHTSSFKGCTGLASVDLSLCEVINEKGFYNCSNLTIDKNLGNVTYIGEDAFFNCVKIEGVINCDKVTGIGQTAFKGCSKLAGIIAPNANIVKGAFENCTSLKYADVKSFYSNAFDGTALNRLKISGSDFAKGNYTTTDNIGTKIANTSVDTLEFGDNVTIIGDYAFCNSGVKYIAFNKVKTIGKEAFAGCYNLLNVGEKIEIQTSILGTKSLVLNGSLSNIESLGDGAFKLCQKLNTKYDFQSIHLDKLTTIPEKAFYGCTSLNSVSAENATVIGVSAFESCTSLRSDMWLITSQENVTVNNNAFKECTSLTAMPLKYASSIGDYAFYNCTNLSLPFLSKTKTIGVSAFENCSSLDGYLTSGDFNVVESIGENAFKGTNIPRVELPNTLETLGAGAFPSVYQVKLNCPKLLEENYTKSDNLLHRFGIAKAGGTGYIEIGDDVTKIGDYAFYNNTYNSRGAMDVEHIRIGDGVTTLGTFSFYGLNATNYIYIGKALPMDKAYYSASRLLMTCENKVTMMHPAQSYDVYLKKDQNWHTIFGKKVKEYELGVGYATGYILPKYALYTESETALQRITFNINPVEDNPQIAVLDDAISGNTNLEYIDLCNAIIIGERSFKDCTKLKSVTIGTDDTEKGACYTSIQANAFNGCTALSSIEIKAVNASVDGTAFTGVKPFIMFDMSDKATLPSVNAGETMFITNKEARAKELRAEKIGGGRKYKYVTSIQRMECEPTDVDMNGKTTGDDAQAVYNSMK